MKTIDFTNCEINKFKAYGGANGNKINIHYQGKSYMLKFPPVARKNKAMSYTNSCISEYIACHVYKILRFDVQETLLGTYTTKTGKQKVVVACQDFTDNGKKLMEFAQLKNTCIDSELNGYGTELDSIMSAINEQNLLSPKEISDFFWNVFIADALLGNFDRHNGNWGLLIDENNCSTQIAPVYDCGSCLYPQLIEEGMLSVMGDENEINKRIYTFPNSAIEENEKKLSYFEFISSLRNEDCNAALKRVCGRIDMSAINQMINETPFISDVQKDFYKLMIRERKEKILDFSLQKLQQRETENIRSGEELELF